jgi:SPP1 family predicted phage head-tail adaptor
MPKHEPDAGNYDKQMVLQSATETNTKGTVTNTWTTIATLDCSLWPIRGLEYYDAKQVGAKVTHLSRTWYRDDITRPAPEMRLVNNDEGRTFEIESVIDVDEAHVEFEFRLVETV